MPRSLLSRLLPAAVILVGMLAIGSAWVLTQPRITQTAAQIGGPFRLTTPEGRIVTPADFAGTPFLVFFGYTHCPDICPTTLSDVSQIFAKLGQERKINAMFVSIDPERDTPQMMKEYMASFDPRILPLSGSPAELSAVYKAYRVYFKKVAGTGDDYSMDHTALVYLMDKEGKFVNAFDIAQPPEAAAQELSRYF